MISFLSTSLQDVTEAQEASIPAARIHTRPSHLEEEIDQIRIAFDGDAVIFPANPKRFTKDTALRSSLSTKLRRHGVPLPEGPFATLLKVLSFLQTDYTSGGDSPIRIALVTARSMPTHERVIRTLNAWNVPVDEAFFMGGVDKTPILEAFHPHIYFDDQDQHCRGPARLFQQRKSYMCRPSRHQWLPAMRSNPGSTNGSK